MSGKNRAQFSAAARRRVPAASSDKRNEKNWAKNKTERFDIAASWNNKGGAQCEEKGYDTVKDSLRSAKEAIQASGQLFESIFQRPFHTIAAGVNFRDDDGIYKVKLIALFCSLCVRVKLGPFLLVYFVFQFWYSFCGSRSDA